VNYAINLLPRELQPRPPLTGKQKMTYAACIAVLVMLLAAYCFLFWSSRAAEARIQSLDDMLAAYNSQKNALEKVNSQCVDLTSKIDVIKSIMENRKTWPVFLRDFADSVPDAIHLETLRLYYAPAVNNEAASKANSNPSPPEKAGSAVDIVKKNLTAIMDASSAATTVPGPDSPQGKSPGSPGNNKQNDSQDIPAGPPLGVFIEGEAAAFGDIGKFVYRLNGMTHFSSVQLLEITQNSGSYYFVIYSSFKVAK
jgi:hypothetical protein